MIITASSGYFRYAQMAEPRKPSVYDYSDLRLHPNARRVQQKATKSIAVVQDARFNWIATDAGGSAKVSLFKRSIKDDTVGEDNDEEIDIGKLSTSGEEEGEDNQKRKRRRRRRRGTDRRTLKKRKFLENDDFLADDSLTESSKALSSDLPNPPPVSDLDILYIHILRIFLSRIS